MTEILATVAVVGLVVMTIVERVIYTLDRRRSMSGYTAAMRYNERSAAIQNAAAMMVIEKLMADPTYMAQLHSRERIETAAMQTSLEREAIQRQRPAPEHVVEPLDPDGVPTDDLEAARR